MNYVFTGPESSGKTTLATKVSELKKGIYIPEAARDYLTNLGREYTINDLLEIAKLQYKLQEEAKQNGDKIICFDTDLLTIKIWSEWKYGTCNPWILDRLYANSNSIYILCKPDFPWQYDDLRENPNDREELFNLYQKELELFNFPYQIVTGTLQERAASITVKPTLFP